MLCRRHNQQIKNRIHSQETGQNKDKIKQLIRKTYKVTKKSLEFANKNQDIDNTSISFNTMKKNNQFINHIFKKKIANNLFIQKSSENLQHSAQPVKELLLLKSSSQVDETDKFYDNEAIKVSSLKTVPKIIKNSSRDKRKNNKFSDWNNSTYITPRAKRRFTRPSVASSTVRYSWLYDDIDSPSPIIQPKYAAL